jgi:hypothetical protein
MKTIGKTINDKGELIDTYECEICGMRTTSKMRAIGHDLREKEYYHEEEFFRGTI